MSYEHIKAAYKLGMLCQIKSPGRDWVDLTPGLNFGFADLDTEYRVRPEYPGFKLAGSAEALPSTGFTMAVFNASEVPVGTQIYIKEV